MTAREEIEAARDAMQARLDAVGDVFPLRMIVTDSESLDGVGARCDDPEGKHDEERWGDEGSAWVYDCCGNYSETLPPGWAALIVAAVNREQRAIDHARRMLARADRLQFAYRGLSEEIIASLHEWWCAP